MQYVNLLLFIVVLTLLVFLVKKARRIDQNTWELRQWMQERLENEFHQVEALLSLTRELDLRNSLPATRSWAGSPDFLLLLLRKIRSNRPQVVVECSSGVSTIVSARALQLNGSGHVYSLEHEPQYAAKTRAELARHGLEAWATVVDAPLVATETRLGTKRWYDTKNLNLSRIDLVVVDGPPESTNPLARYPAGPALIPHLSPTGELVLDDVIRQSEREAIAAWQEDFSDLQVEFLAAEKHVAVVSRRSRQPG